MSPKDKRIGVLLGGLSAEREISLKTGRAICKALLRLGYDAVEIDADEMVVDKLLAERVDCAVVALHGPFGEDGCIQGVLEIVGIPYTGSGVAASAVAMDKRLTKELLAHRGIPTPAWVELHAGQTGVSGLELPFGYPVIVKPVAEGSTFGVHKVEEPGGLAGAVAEASRFGSRLLIESYIDGMEATVGVLNGEALPVIEIVARSGFYDYQAKYTKGETEFVLPARLSEALEQRCRTLALEAYRALECEGVARVDFRIDREGGCYVLEVNTIPGMTETSLIPMAAAHVGISFEQVCERLLEGARLKIYRREVAA